MKCDSALEVRLVPHFRQLDTSNNSGIIEVRHNGVWGTVCDEEFGQNEADVFCKMLGYKEAKKGHRVGWRMSGNEKNTHTYPIWIQFTKVNTCSGDEKSIEDCHDRSLWKHEIKCDHLEDVHLTCKYSSHVSRSHLVYFFLLYTFSLSTSKRGFLIVLWLVNQHLYFKMFDALQLSVN